jgi:hypothetical protein
MTEETFMTNRRRNTGGDAGDGGSPPRMPRWLRIAAIVVGALVLIFIALQLTGVGGQHGPGRHALGGARTSAGVAPQWQPTLAGLR